MKLHFSLLYTGLFCSLAATPLHAAFEDVDGVRTYTGSPNTINLATTGTGALLADTTQIIFDMDGSKNYNYFGATGEFAGNVQIGGSANGGLILTAGNSGVVTKLTGTVTGSGALSKTNGGTNSTLELSGDVTGYTGHITLNASANFTLRFGNGGASVATTADKGASGTGTITMNGNASTLEYNYANSGAPVYVTNEIVKTGGNSKVTLSGAAGMVFTKSVTIDTLTIGNANASATFSAGSIGTVNGTGAGFTKTGSGSLAVGNLGANTLTIEEGSVTGTLTAGTLRAGDTAGTLGTADAGFTLNGGTIDFGTVGTSATLSASGTLTLTTGDLLIGNVAGIADGTEYTLLAGSDLTWGSTDFGSLTVNGAVLGSSGIFYQTVDNQKYKGTLSIADGTNNLVLTISEFTGKDLSWDGGSGTWSAGSTNWNVAGATGGTSAFDGEDAVTFGKNAATDTITLSGELTPVTISVTEGQYIFDGSGSIAGVGTLVLSGTADSAAALAINTQNAQWSGAILLKQYSHLTAGNAAALGTGTITMETGSTLELAAGSWILADRLAAGSAGTLVLSGTATASTTSAFSSIAYNLASEHATLNLSSGTYANAFTGTGCLQINENATVNNAGAFMGTWNIKKDKNLTLGGTGNVTVKAAENAEAGGNIIKGSTEVNLTLEGGSYNNVTAAVGGATNFRGEVTIAGEFQGSNGTGRLGTIELESGAYVKAGQFYIHYQGANTNANLAKTTATVRNGATLEATTRLQIARDGTGILNIEQGGAVIAENLDMGTALAQNWTGTAASGKQATVNLNGGSLYIGAGGITQQKNLALSPGVLNMNSGLLGTTVTSQWSSALDMVIGGNDSGTFTVNTQQYDTATKSYKNAAGSISLKALSGNGSLAKDGLGTLELAGASTYTGSTTVNQGDLRVSGSIGSGTSANTYSVNGSGSLVLAGTGTVANSAVSVGVNTGTAKAATEATLTGVSVTTTAIARTSDSGKGRIANGNIDVTAASFAVSDVELANSMLNIQSAGTVTLTNVTLGAGTRLSSTGGGHLTLANSALILSSDNLATAPAVGSGENAGTVVLSYTMTNATLQNTSFTLDFTAELLREIGALAGGPYTDVRLTLTGVETWEDVQLTLGNEATLLGASITNTPGALNGGVVIDVHFSSPIPEPASATLGLFGLASLLLRRRRRA